MQGERERERESSDSTIVDTLGRGDERGGGEGGGREGGNVRKLRVPSK